MKIGVARLLLSLYMFWVCSVVLAEATELLAKSPDHRLEVVSFEGRNIPLACWGILVAAFLIPACRWAWCGAIAWAAIQIPCFNLDSFFLRFEQFFTFDIPLYQPSSVWSGYVNGRWELWMWAGGPQRGIYVNLIGIILVAWIFFVRKDFRRAAEVGIPAGPAVESPP